MNWTAYAFADVVEDCCCASCLLLMLGQLLKDLDGGVGDGSEDDGNISTSRTTINISKILRNLTKRSYKHHAQQ